MQFESISLGNTPAAEPCAQLGSNDYHFALMNKFECKLFIEMLNRSFPIPVNLERDVRFTTEICYHDFGIYRDVIVKYNSDNPEAETFVCNVELYVPENWDDESLKKLNENEEYMEKVYNKPS